MRKAYDIKIAKKINRVEIIKISEKNIMEIKHKEIDLIQGCINRAANNCFLIKGWFITIIIAIGTIYLNSKDYNVKRLIIFSLIISWILDVYYLKLERKFRKKYEWIIEKREETLDYQYNLNPNEKEMWLSNSKVETGWSILISKSLWIYYIILIFLLGIL